MSTEKEGVQRGSAGNRRLSIFAGACVAMFAAIAAVIWAAGGFSPGGVSGHGLAALIIGSVLTLLVTVALMGLVFYSDRSEHDRDVQDLRRR